MVFLHPAHIQRRQANLQHDQRPGAGVPAPDGPEQVAQNKAPETDSTPAQIQRCDQPGSDHGRQHCRPLQPIDQVHYALQPPDFGCAPLGVWIND